MTRLQLKQIIREELDAAKTRNKLNDKKRELVYALNADDEEIYKKLKCSSWADCEKKIKNIEKQLEKLKEVYEKPKTNKTEYCDECNEVISSKIHGNPIKIKGKIYHPYCAGDVTNKDIKMDEIESPWNYSTKKVDEKTIKESFTKIRKLALIKENIND